MPRAANPQLQATSGEPSQDFGAPYDPDEYLQLPFEAPAPIVQIRTNPTHTLPCRSRVKEESSRFMASLFSFPCELYHPIPKFSVSHRNPIQSLPMEASEDLSKSRDRNVWRHAYTDFKL